MTHSRVLTAAGLVFLFAGAFLPTSALQAQDKPSKKEQRAEAALRAVSGIVVDAEEKPAISAVVQLKDMRSLQVRSFITQTGGEYHFAGLKSDVDYELTAKYNEMSSPTKTLSQFDTRKQAVLNLKVDKK